MGFRVTSLSVGDKVYYPQAEVTAAQITRVRATSGSEDAKKVVGGAVAGAIIGQILGRDRKGTLIGAAAGAAAGGAAAAATADYDGCVDVGAPITVRLTAPLSVAAGS
jgi:outer membrane lipoprotein SlyB